VWFGHNDPRNSATRIPGEAQSNQVGEIAAIIIAASAVSPYQPLKIITDSKYVIEGLTEHLGKWEDDGWIGIKNAKFFKKAAYLLRHRRAKTKFLWTKGHSGNEGNEESDRLAKEGASKQEEDELDLEIPVEFESQGTKLATLTQAKAYQGIMEKMEVEQRRAARINLQLTREAIHQTTSELESDPAIWCSIRKPVFRTLIQQFLFKTIHNTHMTGKYWRNIPNCEDREMCATCNTTDSMSHILTQCRENDTQLIWTLARDLWPYPNFPWPEINLGTILGCGTITLKAEEGQRNNHQPRRKTFPGPTRLLQIIISEAAYLIWLLRGERVIQGTNHPMREIKARWLRVINERLTIDKITATRIKRTDGFTNLVVETWEQALGKEGELPPNWISQGEVLVGRTA
jgi:ribonuclease HI